jgi:hypothetical protein
MDEAQWRPDNSDELQTLAATLEAEVTLLEQELAQMGAFA